MLPRSSRHPAIKKLHRGRGILGLLLILLSLWQILGAAQGLEITSLPSAAPPLTVIAPAKASASRPVVLIAHGFAGSALVMRGFGLTLAHAGYTVVLWDFNGHGANPQPLSLEAEKLVSNAEAALAEAQRRGLVALEPVAILGHSMGSGVALAFGQTHPETAATIAVSPVRRSVTPDLPRNLLLMAGSLESPFVHNAKQLLSEAGGPGKGRKLVVIPGVEHISVLFAPAAHAAARDWLDAILGPQPGAKPYTDQRMLWYGLGLAGALLAATALAPLLPRSAPRGKPQLSLRRRLASLAGGALGATLLLWLINQAGLNLSNLLGLLIGGYLIIWFGAAGILNLLLFRIRPSLPSRPDALRGLLAFAALWLGLGLLGQLVWIPWLLIPHRLLLWLPGALLLLPWFLTVGEAMQGTSAAGKLGWWLGHSSILVASLLIAMLLSPELGFLTIILPLFPIVLGLHALAAAPHEGSWPFALSGAAFTAWMLLVIFPLQ